VIAPNPFIRIVRGKNHRWQWFPKTICHYEAVEGYLCFGWYCSIVLCRWSLSGWHLFCSNL